MIESPDSTVNRQIKGKLAGHAQSEEASWRRHPSQVRETCTGLEVRGSLALRTVSHAIWLEL